MHSMSWPRLLYLAYNQFIVPRSHPIALNWHAVLVRFDLLFICLQQLQWRYTNPFVSFHFLLRHVKNDHRAYVLCDFFQMQNDKRTDVYCRCVEQTNAQCAPPFFTNQIRRKSGCAFALFAFIISVWILVTKWACNCNDVVQHRHRHSVRYHCSSSVSLFHVSRIRFFSFRPNKAQAMYRVLHIPSWLMFWTCVRAVVKIHDRRTEEPQFFFSDKLFWYLYFELWWIHSNANRIRSYHHKYWINVWIYYRFVFFNRHSFELIGALRFLFRKGLILWSSIDGGGISLGFM